MLVSNIIYNLFVQIVNIGFPILSQFFLVRNVGLHNISLINYLMALYSLAILLPNSLNVYLIAQLPTLQSNEIKRLITNSMFVNLYISLISVFIFHIFTMFTSDDGVRQVDVVSINLLELCIIISNFLFPHWFYSNFQTKKLFQIKIISKLIMIILVIFYVKNPETIQKYAYCYFITSFIEALMVIVSIGSCYDFKTFDLSLQYRLIKIAVRYLMFNLVFGQVLQYATIVGYGMSNNHAYAEFSIVNKIVNLATTMVTTSVMVLLPFFQRKDNAMSNATIAINKSMCITAFFSIVITACLLLFKPIIYYLFMNENYDTSLSVNDLIYLYIITHSIYNYHCFMRYIAIKKEYFLIWTNALFLMLYFIIQLVDNKIDDGNLAGPIIATHSLGLLLFTFIYERKTYNR